MSKSKGNYPDVNEVFDRDGSDAMRWFLMSSPILRGGNLIVTERGIREGVGQPAAAVERLDFLQLYASKPGGGRARIRTNVLDRYILAKLARTRDVLTEALEVYDIAGACDELRSLRSTRSPTGTCAGRGRGSGRRTRTRSTPCTRCSR